jgi:hypothetical protein
VDIFIVWVIAALFGWLVNWIKMHGVKEEKDVERNDSMHECTKIQVFNEKRDI